MMKCYMIVAHVEDNEGQQFELLGIVGTKQAAKEEVDRLILKSEFSRRKFRDIVVLKCKAVNDDD